MGHRWAAHRPMPENVGFPCLFTTPPPPDLLPFRFGCSGPAGARITQDFTKEFTKDFTKGITKENKLKINSEPIHFRTSDQIPRSGFGPQVRMHSDLAVSEQLDSDLGLGPGPNAFGPCSGQKPFGPFRTSGSDLVRSES